MTDFLKLRKSAPDGFGAAEAAGLRWLAEPGVVPVVDVVEHGADFLRLRRLEETGPSAEAAAAFPRRPPYPARPDTLAEAGRTYSRSKRRARRFDRE